MLDAATASRFARIALGHVTREYPNKLDQTLDGDADLRPPRALHPIFHGSFDWHSCVHSHWMLAAVLRRFPDMAEAAPIRARFDAAFTARNVAGECATLSRPSARGFKRPYGWGWLLKLSSELRRHDAPWAATMRPLAEVFAARLRDFLPRATYPVRVGTHFNTAFALRMAADDADEPLLGLLRDTALRWYGPDAACPAWGEPSGDDFLSGALIEAECMRRLLPPADFAPWFSRFLPNLARTEPATLFRPAAVSDRSDGKIAHLDGLNLSRAWCWHSLASSLPADDPRRPPMLDAARAHRDAALPHLADDYMGEHWLASFALLALGED